MASGFPFALLLCLSIGLLAPSCCGQTSCPGPCPPGWPQFGSRCFSFNFKGKSWTDAEIFCKSDGGNLASVHSEEEHVFLRDYIRKVTGENKQTWMGGFDSVQEGEWMWSDGSTFDYKHWGPGQPDNHRVAEHCLQMNHHDKWNDDTCTNIYPFLCSKKLWHQAFHLLCCSVCPSDCWLHLVMDKPPAQNFCKSDGGNLASVHSEEEHVFLRDYIRKVTGENKKTWMGGFDSVQEGEWMWSDGSTFDYKHWGPGQPDNAGGVEHCLEMNYRDKWNNAPCNIISPFLCSKNL